nr:MAG TPA: hypothetical protein [Caudoviricetes sp.]
MENGLQICCTRRTLCTAVFNSIPEIRSTLVFSVRCFTAKYKNSLRQNPKYLLST